MTKTFGWLIDQGGVEEEGERGHRPRRCRQRRGARARSSSPPMCRASPSRSSRRPPGTSGQTTCLARAASVQYSRDGSTRSPSCPHGLAPAWSSPSRSSTRRASRATVSGWLK